MKWLSSILAAFAVHSAFTAEPVALSLTNAECYVSTIPINSNLLQGVGMGADGAYATIRAEDLEFLMSAAWERFVFTSGTGGRYAEEGTPGTPRVKRLPVVVDSIYGDSISNSFPLTWGHNPFRHDESLSGDVSCQRCGFVPDPFPIWDGVSPSQSTNGWVRNGHDAYNDFRAVFLPESRPFTIEELQPAFALTNLFRGVPSLFAVTNAYAILDSALCSNLLAIAEISDPVGSPAMGNRTTNEWRSIYSTWTSSHNPVDSYEYNGETYYLYGNQVVTNAIRNRQLLSREVMGQGMGCSIERVVRYYTHYNIRRTSASSGDTTLLTPYKESDVVISSLPSNGTPWMLKFEIPIGAHGGDPWTYGTAYNTNITIKAAWFVSCWECTSSWIWEWNLPDGGGWSSSSTSSVVRVLSSYPLGPLVPSGRYPSGGTNQLWTAQGDYEGFGTTVFDVQKAFLEIAGSFFDNGDFYDVEITSPKILSSTDIPSIVTNDWSDDEWQRNGRLRQAQATTTRRHQLQSVRNYVVLLVNPVYVARVLGAWPQ